jgi:hypothetical protein
MKKARYIASIFAVALLFAACQKNNVSKIPHIELTLFSPDSMIVNIDTCFIKFSLIDGDGDIGNSNTSQIYLKDSRFDSAGFLPTPFPDIDPTIEDPLKGLVGTCTVNPVPQPVPRSDSNHLLHGDTMFYEMYIMDRAGHQSNHVITHTLIIRP